MSRHLSDMKQPNGDIIYMGGYPSSGRRFTIFLIPNRTNGKAAFWAVGAEAAIPCEGDFFVEVGSSRAFFLYISFILS
jgi:hypothetical protein